MVSAFSRWKRYDETRQNLAKVSSWCHFFCGWNNHPKALMLPPLDLPLRFVVGWHVNLYPNWHGLIQAQLEMIVSANGLSENVFEIASKSLAA